MAPPLALAIGIIARTVNNYSLVVTPDWMWASLGPRVTLALTVFIGDFTSYWRHRLEHTRWLWPTHAIHHSDTEMTWLTGNRFHPANRLVTTIVDNTVLAMLGAPPWTIAANELIRHYYGEFVHADMPWTYGPLGAIFVLARHAPVAHRGKYRRGKQLRHHVLDLRSPLRDTAPTDLCDVPLGVTDDIGRGAMRQLAYPFRSWVTDALERGGRVREHAEAPVRVNT